MPDYQNDLVVLTVGGINSKSTGATNLAVTENGTQRFYPIFITVTAEAATSITVAPSLSIGTNSAAYDNIYPITSVFVTSVNTTFTQLGCSNITSVAANTTIAVKVTTAATGTSQTIRVDLIGYYV